MAVTIDATAGGANANSYITLSEANTFVEAMIESTDVGKWTTGTDDTPQPRWLQRLNVWIGKDL